MFFLDCSSHYPKHSKMMKTSAEKLHIWLLFLATCLLIIGQCYQLISKNHLMETSLSVVSSNLLLFILTLMDKILFLDISKYIWDVSCQLPQRAAREPQIVLYLTHVYDNKIYLKKLFDKRVRRIFSSAFQWCRQFIRNFPFSPLKSTKRVISQKVYF